MVWSTKKYNEYLELLKLGNKNINNYKNTPFYENNLDLKKGNIIFEYTKEEIEEIKKYANDIIYFVENYCYIKVNNGYELIKLRKYQYFMLKQFQNERNNIVLAARQIGKTITASLFLCWYALFHNDKNILLLANKWATTKEIMNKIKKILSFLPFFLKPGILKYDVYEMVFDNGSKIIGQTTTEKSGIGFTIDLLYLDEFAHIKHTFINDFFENVLPTISANSNTKIIITSTPNGANKFYELYKGAVEGKNNFKPFKVDWYEVPGRDEKWRDEQIALLGQEGFNRQYGNQFFSSGNLLVPASLMKILLLNKKDYNKYILNEVYKYGLNLECEFNYRNDISIDYFKKENKFFFIGLDIAGGNGNDYTVFNIYELFLLNENLWKYLNATTYYDFFGLKQIGYIRSNKLKVDDFAKIVYILINEKMNIENLKIVIENNYNGEYFINSIMSIFENINNIDESIFVKFKRNDKFEYGIRINKNKNLICEEFVKYLGNGRIVINNYDTIKELENFVFIDDSYKAQIGHDDMIMSSIILSQLFNINLNNSFRALVDAYYDYIIPQAQEKIEKYLVQKNLK